MENEEIISNDINLKITKFTNAKRILLNNLKIRKYETIKDCVYDLYGTIIYNAIDEKHRRRILYEYFKDKNYTILKDKSVEFDVNIKNFTDFCIVIRNLEISAQNNYQDFYEIYLHNHSINFRSFKEDFYKHGFSVFTPLNAIEKLVNFTYEYYYFLLKSISEDIGLDKIEEVVLDFYFQIQDLYYDQKIYFKMEYKSVLPLLNNSKSYQTLLKSVYSPEDIYYCFMYNLEERCKDKTSLTELDIWAISEYNKFLEESKEEGEI